MRNQELYQKVVKFVDKSYGKKKSHYERTVYWILQLDSDVDAAMKIAGYSHDIQSAFSRGDNMKTVKESEKGFKDEELLTTHQKEGAEIMKKFLEDNEGPPEVAKKVYDLISKHETGGNDDQNILKDADSISFLECNAEHFVDKYAIEFGYTKVKEKFDWMFNRISSAKARDIAKPMYENAIAKLEKMKQNEIK